VGEKGETMHGTLKGGKMSKYRKGDIRYNPVKNLFSRFITMKEFRGYNRASRRAMMARFRSTYGRAAYIEARRKMREKKLGIIEVIKTYIAGRHDKQIDRKNAFAALAEGKQ
jgi:hypothetical protein